MADGMTKVHVGDHPGRPASEGTRKQPGSAAENALLPEDDENQLPLEYDRRGIALPRRHKVGGIITPQ
jgi:hypothetical protein